MYLKHSTVARLANCFKAAAVLLVLTVACLWSIAAAHQPQGGDNVQAPEERVRRMIEKLEPNNRLRYALERGDRGSGPHHAWMDQMRQQAIKQASYSIRFLWSPTHKNLKIEDTAYLTDYYLFDTKITNASKLNDIDRSGLKRALERAILARAKENLTERARELKSEWLCGVLYLNLLDDEVLPILDVPAYYDGWSAHECKQAKC